MKRREFIALLGNAVTCPLAARAQHVPRVLRVGTVGIQSKTTAIYIAFLQRMAELGHEEGKNFEFEYVRVSDVDETDSRHLRASLRAGGVRIKPGSVPALSSPASAPCVAKCTMRYAASSPLSLNCFTSRSLARAEPDVTIGYSQGAGDRAQLVGCFRQWHPSPNFPYIGKTVALLGHVRAAPWHSSHARQWLLRAMLPGARKLHPRAISAVKQGVTEAHDRFLGLAGFGILAQGLQRRDSRQNGDRVALGEPRGPLKRHVARYRQIGLLRHEHVEWDMSQWT
jgi:hypothetical protein